MNILTNAIAGPPGLPPSWLHPLRPLNGKEAVTAFLMALDASRGYELVCMDVVMPEMNGHQAVRLIR